MSDEITIEQLLAENAELKKQLEEVTTTDQLTGVYNRKMFFQLGEREVTIHHRHKRPLTLLLLDIDHFRTLNEEHGNETGDRALVFFTKICKYNLRTSDIFGRMGGGEFAIILPDTELENSKVVAERIRCELEKYTPTENNNIPAMTVSIGGAVRMPDDDLEKILLKADAKLFEAKESGRNKVVLR